MAVRFSLAIHYSYVYIFIYKVQDGSPHWKLSRGMREVSLGAAQLTHRALISSKAGLGRLHMLLYLLLYFRRRLHMLLYFRRLQEACALCWRRSRTIRRFCTSGWSDPMTRSAFATESAQCENACMNSCCSSYTSAILYCVELTSKCSGPRAELQEIYASVCVRLY